MANPLLDHVAPEYLARRTQVLEIVDKLSTFERLSEIVQADFVALGADRLPAGWQDTAVKVQLQFGWADARERLPEVRGSAETELPAVCQRCLEPCTLSLSTSFRMLLLNSKDSRSIDDALEVWGVEENKLRPLDVVEEMLVMAIPLAAMHTSDDNCIQLPGSEKAEEKPNTIRPFADLKAQIEKSR
ncbi:MAG: DUF177 domain-containing protein, partial [Woeseia sp.]